MSTPEQRAKNREKQKRYYDHHPEYRALKRSRNTELTKSQKIYCTFELADPRDEERVPRLVYWGKLVTPVWTHLWSVKEYSHSRWAAWLRELNLLGLVPIELTGWALGRNEPLTAQLAEQLVKSRINYICRAVGHRPSWLLNSQGPVGRLLPTGKVEHFSRMWKRWKLVHSGDKDSEGNIWFED